MQGIRSSMMALVGLAALAALAAGCGPKYPKCDKDAQCADKGEVCVEGLCQQCRDDGQCAAGQQCKGGRCEAKPECASNADCSGNQICRSGKCQLECSADGDCGAGLKCANNRCVDKNSCDSAADCAPGMACIGGRCQAQTSQASRAMCDYPTVRFPFNEATLSGSVKSGLQQVADCLKSKSASARLVVEGHCDERGTEEYNLALGDRRARAVQDFLKRLGVPAARIEVISKGEAQPLDGRSTEDAWEKNRRAEFIEK